MKRFYRTSGTEVLTGGHGVTLDGRPVKTPRRATLMVPTAGLAAAIANEWDGQGETVDPEIMPLMRLATTAIDRVGPERAAILEDLTAYGGSDLICYRTDSPAELAQRQMEAWQPFVDWAAARHDALLAVTSGILHVEQPEPAVSALARALEGLDDFHLMAAHTLTVSTGSLVIALAFLDRHVDGAAAFEAGCLDDLYALEVWGDDRDAWERLDGLKASILAVERFISLLHTEG
ncbi:MAG: ATPase [Rhodospirillales bacterium]|nr:ATPase [Rhodospirillales bacterium]